MFLTFLKCKTEEIFLIEYTSEYKIIPKNIIHINNAANIRYVYIHLTSSLHRTVFMRQ